MKNLNSSGIYFIINLINGKIYVGNATKFKNRFKHHKYYLNNNNHHNLYLQRAWNKYGADAFQFTIVEIVEDVKDLVRIEQLWINASNCCNENVGYNSRKIAESNIGLKHKPESLIKMSIAQKGKVVSLETRQKLYLANIGKQHSEESKLKMSITRKGRKYSKEWINNIANANRGQKRSDEVKAKMRLAWKNRKLVGVSEETKLKLSIARKGRQPARNKLKWPHELGSKCKCYECMEKKREYMRNFNKNQIGIALRKNADVAKLVETQST